MDSDRDVESRSSPMTSARDALWRNIRAISNLMSGNRNLQPTHNSNLSLQNVNEINSVNNSSLLNNYNNQQRVGGVFHANQNGSNMTNNPNGADNTNNVNVGFVLNERALREGRLNGTQGGLNSNVYINGITQVRTGFQSSTASASNNRDEHEDYLAGEPVIVHDENHPVIIGGSGAHPYASNQAFLRRHQTGRVGQFEEIDLNARGANINGDDIYADDVISPMVMIDREKEATLSEEEVRQIIDIYNKNLDGATKENTELKDQINQLVAHLREEEQRVYGVQQEIQELKNQQVSSQAELEKVNLQVSLLKFFKETKESNPYNEDKEVEDFKKQMQEKLNIDTDEDIPPDVLEDIEEQIKQMKRLEYQVKLLEMESRHLTQAQFNLSEHLNQSKRCVNCRSDFKPQQNNDESCVYHPGRMKYYSCKGCGAAEYYSCCWRCQKCNAGCKLNKHIAEAD